MKVVKVSIELVIDDKNCGNSNDDIANYLNNMLYNDPEFFGGFGPENIIGVVELED